MHGVNKIVKSNIHKRTNVIQLGSMFICNCNIALHVSDAFCVHLQEHLEIVKADTLNVCFSLNVRDQISCPCRIADKIIVLYILVSIFVDSKLEDIRFCTKSKHSLHSNCL